MTGDRSTAAQRAIDFLSRLDVGEVDFSSLPASADYGALSRLARRAGVDTDEAALQEAFATIMRARLIASLRVRA
jgi:hypothetical protein